MLASTWGGTGRCGGRTTVYQVRKGGQGSKDGGGGSRLLRGEDQTLLFLRSIFREKLSFVEYKGTEHFFSIFSFFLFLFIYFLYYSRFILSVWLLSDWNYSH